ncbi:MAG: glycosyl transferase family 2 [Bacteroidales bacterium]|nr:glycosyl transferase family 2 [Bacteroidales bacterium]
MEQNTGIIIQARTGSSRLPNKIFLPFYKNKNLLELLIEKLKTCGSTPIVVATTTSPADDAIVKLADRMQVSAYRGSENNVLERFIDAATHFSFNTIIRVCSDNPFIDIDGLLQLIQINDVADYTCFSANGVPTIKTHFGFWAEKVKLKALIKVSETTNEKLFLEHVTNFLYTHPEMFTIKKTEVPQYISNKKIRLTLDTIDDFNMQKDLYNALILKFGNRFTLADIVGYLDDNTIYYDLMKQNIEKNEK